MYHLRQVHKESGKQTTFEVGTLYTPEDNGRQFFPDMKENKRVLCGAGGEHPFTHILGEGFDYFVMTDSGKTIERLYPLSEKS